MTDLLDNPAVQAAAIPFVVALAIAFLLASTRFLAAAVLSGVVVVLVLTVGLSLEPLTSVKKLMLSVVVVTALGLALEVTRATPRRAGMAGLAIVAGAGAVWMITRVLQQMESALPWLVGLAAFAFVAVMVAASLAAGAASPLRAAVVGACLGWGSGVLALLGASALLAQIGLAVGTASAAVALVQMLRGADSPMGWTLIVPAAVTAATVGVLASTTGELSWYCLLPLPCAPLLAWRVQPNAARPAWQRAFLAGSVAAVPVAIAVGLAWWSARSSSPGA